ncbi:hypothetical protein P9A16_03810 [Shinella sp. 838]|uniref:hypothetical protein n=1 Tax=Shinella sp. 838 TaxID=3038164 RepID=UPI0024158753|nr:hypothetical protein [Shinella sp. 838]MDG4670233.1 hypothetical protein [Shinella sp. 838]
MSRDSEKPVVFSHLFQRVFDPASGTVSEGTVTQHDIQEAIILLQQEEGISLKPGNPANFLKDFLRSHSRNAHWPEEIADARYTARQAYGDGRVFEFVPYADEQEVPFPDDFALPENASIHPIEAVSLPSAARALGRGDEAWLIQVCVHQRLLQTHFALFSDIEVIDLFHLQNSLKGTPEIDAVFLLVFDVAGTEKKALVTLEAKRGDPILPDQIRGQVAFMAKQTRKRAGLKDVEFIVPVAANTLKRDGKTVVSIFEMEPMSVADGIAAHDGKSSHELPLVISKSVGYSLSPQVSGI